MQDLIVIPIEVMQARQSIERECCEVFPNWGGQAKWFSCTLDTEEFQRLLVFDGGRPHSLWQEFANGSYEISHVAIGIRDYGGGDVELSKWRNAVLSYEMRMNRGEFPTTLRLVRTGDKGRITLFETNRRALALYLHCFVARKRQFSPVKGILVQVENKLPFQSR